MIGVAMYTTIKTLWKKHKNKALITKLTGHDWKTVAKRIKEIEQEKEYQPQKPHPRLCAVRQVKVSFHTVCRSLYLKDLPHI